MADQIIPVSKTTQPATEVASAPSAPARSTQPVVLPSKGYFYPENSKLSSGTIEIHRITARHEDILSNTNFLKKGTVLDEFLKAVIATPEVDLNDLLIGDKNALFIAARKGAYGELYNTKIKCLECGAESSVDIDISNLKPVEINWSLAKKGENRIPFKLPDSGKLVQISLLTHRDEVDIDRELKALAKFGAQGASPEMTTRLKYMIKSIDGDSDRAKIKVFVDENMSAKDSLALRRFAREVSPDLDLTFDFTCPACGHQAKKQIPLGPNFFWPNISDA